MNLMICWNIYKKKIHCNGNSLGENIELDGLIVLDNVSGLTDRLERFANFFTVARKFGLTCVYVFHKLSLTRQNWQMIPAQTKIFNIFPGSMLNLEHKETTALNKFAIIIEIKKKKHLIPS